METSYSKRKARGAKTIGMVVTNEQHRQLRAAAALADVHLGEYVHSLVIADLRRQGIRIDTDDTELEEA